MARKFDFQDQEDPTFAVNWNGSEDNNESKKDINKPTLQKSSPKVDPVKPDESINKQAVPKTFVSKAKPKYEPLTEEQIED